MSFHPKFNQILHTNNDVGNGQLFFSPINSYCILKNKFNHCLIKRSFKNINHIYVLIVDLDSKQLMNC
jgi:hypothetical protein